MSGLAKICKKYGSIKVTDSAGKKAIWVWDYVNDVPRLKTEINKKIKHARHTMSTL